MQPEYKKYTESNRRAWNEVMPRHQQAAKQKWDAAFLQPGYVCMKDEELRWLRQVGVENKAVAHLCCNNGVELLSLKNLGAGECTGFDISDEAIQEAQERAARSNIDCQFVCSDVYEIGPEYEDRFDLVYISVGALGWIPDLDLFFAKAAALLRPGGRVFIHEIHPFADLLPLDDGRADLLRIVEPYFRPEPFIEYGSLDYVGGSEYTSDIPQYWFLHTLSDILMGLVNSHLAIEQFSEQPDAVSPQHKVIEKLQAGVPLSYILTAKKFV
jgi:SAM-dependent methyltransferase